MICVAKPAMYFFVLWVALHLAQHNFIDNGMLSAPKRLGGETVPAMVLPKMPEGLPNAMMRTGI